MSVGKDFIKGLFTGIRNLAFRELEILPNIWNVDGMNRIRRGFTLVEIMITVLIIGILLSIAVPQWVRAREQTRTRSCLRNLTEIDNAKSRWAMENRQGGTASPTEAEIAPIFIRTQMPICPSGGTYTINNVDTESSCSIHGTTSALIP